MYVNGTGRDYYEFYIQLNRCGTLGENTHHQDSRKNPTVSKTNEHEHVVAPARRGIIMISDCRGAGGGGRGRTGEKYDPALAVESGPGGAVVPFFNLDNQRKLDVTLCEPRTARECRHRYYIE